MNRGLVCDRQDCGRPSKWFVGYEHEDTDYVTYSRGHASCDTHLAEACMITLGQLTTEGYTQPQLNVRPIESVETV